jgi:hypothetical protein
LKLCSRGDWSWRRRWFFQRKTRTFFHELPWQNTSCLVTHTLEVPSTKATIRVFWGATWDFLFLWLEKKDVSVRPGMKLARWTDCPQLRVSLFFMGEALLFSSML